MLWRVPAGRRQQLQLLYTTPRQAVGVPSAVSVMVELPAPGATPNGGHGAGYRPAVKSSSSHDKTKVFLKNFSKSKKRFDGDGKRILMCFHHRCVKTHVKAVRFFDVNAIQCSTLFLHRSAAFWKGSRGNTPRSGGCPRQAKRVRTGAPLSACMESGNLPLISDQSRDFMQIQDGFSLFDCVIRA